MLFHVTFEVYDNVVLDGDKRLREMAGPQMQRLMESSKVREAGLLSSKRGGFFLVDIDAPEELYKLFGPEIYGSCAVDAQPVTPIETAGEIFQQWAEEGR
jgi:hypothetical protein